MAGMKWSFAVSLVVLSISAALTLADSKYSKERNIAADKLQQENPFRARKVNMLWEKAKKRLSPDQLSDMFRELGFYDKMTMEYKKKSAEIEDYDEDGAHEALLRQTLLKILQRYGMSDTHPDLDPNKAGDLKNNKAWEGDDKNWEKIMADKKMYQLWEKATAAGFSDGELDALKMEFLHHQQKIDEYQELKSSVDHVGIDDMHENSIHRFTETGDDAFKIVKEKKRALKNVHQELKESYVNLERTAIDRAEKLAFEDHRVVELWMMLKKSNIPEEELKSFKQELKHFEHKLKKRDYFVKEADAANLHLSSASESNPSHAAKANVLEQKVDDYNRKIKKIHIELKDRVEETIAKHMEL